MISNNLFTDNWPGALLSRSFLRPYDCFLAGRLKNLNENTETIIVCKEN